MSKSIFALAMLTQILAGRIASASSPAEAASFARAASCFESVGFSHLGADTNHSVIMKDLTYTEMENYRLVLLARRTGSLMTLTDSSTRGEIRGHVKGILATGEKFTLQGREFQDIYVVVDDEKGSRRIVALAGIDTFDLLP